MSTGVRSQSHANPRHSVLRMALGMGTVRLVVGGMLLLTLTGCGGGPYRTTQTGRDEGYLRFSGARSGQSVYVDGVQLGSAEEFSGKPGVLATTPGLRIIEVREGNKVI